MTVQLACLLNLDVFAFIQFVIQYCLKSVFINNWSGSVHQRKETFCPYPEHYGSSVVACRYHIQVPECWDRQGQQTSILWRFHRYTLTIYEFSQKDSIHVNSPGLKTLKISDSSKIADSSYLKTRSVLINPPYASELLLRGFDWESSCLLLSVLMSLFTNQIHISTFQI